MSYAPAPCDTTTCGHTRHYLGTTDGVEESYPTEADATAADYREAWLARAIIEAPAGGLPRRHELMAGGRAAWLALGLLERSDIHTNTEQEDGQHHD